MSKNIVFEGWLTKSPPTKRIWRTKWRRRWFALRQSGELPGQYFLDYYADRNCRRLKGTINLDLCEQVDAGLHMERSSNGTLDPKLRGSVFTIQTQSRTYHLEAECEADMAKWVDAICRVCGLQAKEGSSNALDTYQNNYQMTTMNERIEGSETTGPYIPISECITGVRAQNSQRAFTFDPKNIVVSTRRQTDRVPNRNHQMYMSQPHIRPNNADVSENDSNLSEEECKSLNASQSNIREYSAARSYSKPAGRPNTDEDFQDGPPVPPRPPKTFAMSKDPSVNTLQPPKIIEPNDAPERFSNALLRVPGRMPSVGPPSPGRAQAVFTISRNDDDEECSGQSLQSMQYCNLVSLPPVVDRNLKPRYSSHSIGHVNNLGVQTVVQINRTKEVRSTVIQYLDLDLHTSDPPTSKGFPLIHGRSPSSLEARSAYKTVDFLKTEAFNITRQDAEASRSLHH
ncbi:GRB2-associated-binding protein 1 isoform X3 [Battus philenor]|uniref:GRB2-associated-binding protein 1 isoform X3 n=1 Tax=Battus philenor TaxID=42288 RepID=UPI0035D0E545